VSTGGGSGPTLVVGFGSFGAEVLERLREIGVGGAAPVRRRQVLVELSAEGETANHVAEIVSKAEGLLGLDAAFQADPGDERRPTLDVFMVADLGDDLVAASLPELVSAVGERLLVRFSNIFPGHDVPNLTICPVVALLGLRDGQQPDAADVSPAQKALHAIERRAGKVSFRSGDASPVARVFVVEQQSARYELRPREVVSTVVAFVSLVVGTDLRQREPLRSFLRSSIGHVRDKRMFASFGCATLELSLKRYCVARAAGELVDGMRAASAAGVGEHAVAAQRLIPDAEAMSEELCAPSEGDDLVQLLRAHTPSIEFPSIGQHDTPEQIRNVAYGWGWFDALDNAVKAQVKRLDEREMDEVTRVADERGLKKLRRLQRDLRRELRDAELSGPHGWADALRIAEHVRDRASRQLAELEAELKNEQLPQFPKPTAVESAFRSLREESTFRPRPYRSHFFGALAAIVLGALLHHVPKWFAVCILDGAVSPFSLFPSSMDTDVGHFKYLLDPPYVFFWLTAVFAVVIYFMLDRYRKKRHEALLGERDNLQSSVRRYLTDGVGPSVRRYYESRLWLSLHAWSLRALHRVREIAEREVERLSNISTALDRLSRELASEARRAERVAEGEGGDLVYRTSMSAEVLREAYAVARPASDLTHHLFAEMEQGDSDVPPYLFESKLRAFIAPHAQPSTAQLGELAGSTVVEFVQQRHGKLGVPLEVRSMDERTAEQRYLFAPAWAEAPLRELRQSLATLPEPLIHDDPDRVHLVSLQTALTRDSITLPQAERAEDTPT
jgi:hypothetical protein